MVKEHWKRRFHFFKLICVAPSLILSLSPCCSSKTPIFSALNLSPFSLPVLVLILGSTRSTCTTSSTLSRRSAFSMCQATKQRKHWQLQGPMPVLFQVFLVLSVRLVCPRHIQLGLRHTRTTPGT